MKCKNFEVIVQSCDKGKCLRFPAIPDTKGEEKIDAVYLLPHGQNSHKCLFDICPKRPGIRNRFSNLKSFEYCVPGFNKPLPVISVPVCKQGAQGNHRAIPHVTGNRFCYPGGCIRC